jgi:carbon monoxide dehydrogenase subunit G
VASAEREIVIDRPVEEVYGFLANAENDPQWRPGVLDISRASGEGVGAVYRQGVKGPMGRRISADVETTELVLNELIAFRTRTGPVRPTGRYELSRADGGTRVRFRLDADLTGAKKLLMGRMVEKTMRSEVDALENLKRVLETR